jgi:hypothetical protein
MFLNARKITRKELMEAHRRNLIRQLRENILRRCAAIGCHINEKNLATAEAIVEAKIIETGYARLDEDDNILYPSLRSKLMKLLVWECAQALLGTLPRRPEPTSQLRTWANIKDEYAKVGPRLVVENG